MRSFPRSGIGQKRRSGGLPHKGRQRHQLLAVGGVLIVLACAAAGAVVAKGAGNSTTVLVIAHLVPAGTTVTAADLKTVSISRSTSLRGIPPQKAAQVVGRRAGETLEPGSLLVTSELASAHGLADGKALVGTALAINQMPSELAPGEHVLVVLSGTNGTEDSSSNAAATTTQSSQVSPQSAPGSILAHAIVVFVTAPSSSSATTEAESSAYVVSLEVPATAAAAVSAASAAGDVSLAVLGGDDSTGTSK